MKLTYRVFSLNAAAILFGTAAFVVKEDGPMTKTVYVVDVKSPAAPVFSNQCAACMQPRPEPVVSLYITALHSRMDYYHYGFTKPYPDQHSLQVPMHDRCIKEIRNAFAWRVAVIVAAAILIGIAAYAGKWGGFFSGMLALLMFGMLLSFLAKDPMPVEYSRSRLGEMRFYFKDKAYAEDFARRNHSTVKEGPYLTQYYPG